MTHALPSQLYLWDKRTLYLGPLFEPIELSQGAATLTIALSGCIEFKTPDMNQSIQCKSLLLPAGFDISINTFDSVVANCNLDAVGADWNALNKRANHHVGAIGYNLDCEEHFQNGLREIYHQQMTSDDAYEQLEMLMDHVFSQLNQPYKIDERISKVIELIKEKVDDNVSVEDLASAVNLSVPRLVQLFKLQTGVPIRRYRQWHRLYTTSIKMGLGYNLTEAALAAGFSDSAHFTNTFKSMLGMKPSTILAQPNQIRINIPAVS